jgi:molybdopterin-guanine dinucleotide biosynthesis protein A
MCTGRPGQGGTECYDFLMDLGRARAGEPRQTAGFVLAGGRSTRMGRDKALLPYRGQPLILHVAAEVSKAAKAAGSVTIVGGPASYRDLGLPYIADQYPDFGPVGGIATALSTSSAEWNVIVACDMPGLRAQFLRTLRNLTASEFDAVVPQTPDGRVHPLCAIYSLVALPVFEAAIQQQIHKLTDLLPRLRVRFAATGDSNSCLNMNTPQDWTLFQKADTI